MIGPLAKFGFINPFSGMLVALVLGFWFGYVLERAGFGDPRKLTAIFYLRDFAVLKVMFTAIVVAMLGLFGLARLGLIDLGKVFLLPTYLWPQVVGGLLLGTGFVIGGYCPTTSIVASVSGKLDGLVFVAGMMGGACIFAEAFPILRDFYLSGSMGQVRLSSVFSVPTRFVIPVVVMMAVGAFAVAEKVEERFSPGGVDGDPSPRFKMVGAALIMIMALSLAMAGPIPSRLGGGGEGGMTPELEGPSPPPEASEVVIPQTPPSTPQVIMGDDEGC